MKELFAILQNMFYLLRCIWIMKEYVHLIHTWDVFARGNIKVYASNNIENTNKNTELPPLTWLCTKYIKLAFFADYFLANGYRFCRILKN